MTVGVMTLLEGAARDEALRLWRVFEREYGSVGVQTFAHPNLTFGGGACGDVEELGHQLERLARDLQPVEVHISGVGFFDEPRRAAFLEVAGSEPLEQIHRRIDHVLQHCCNDVFGLYRPGRWVPHVTVAMGDLSPEAMERARQRFSSYDASFVHSARKICLVRAMTDGPGFEVVGRWRLEG